MKYKITTIKLGDKQYKTIVGEITEHSMITIDLIKELDKDKNITINKQQLYEISSDDSRKIIGTIILKFSLARREFKATFLVVRHLVQEKVGLKI